MPQELQRRLEETKAKLKVHCWGREGSPVLQSLVGPFQAFKHPTCTDKVYEEKIAEASTNASGERNK